MIVRQGMFRGERATGNISGFAVGKNKWVSLRQETYVGLRLGKIYG